MDTASLDDILMPYSLGRPERVTGAGGTAGETYRLETNKGVFFLRLRGARTSGPELVRRDHALRAHLLAHGVPTAAPLATRTGETFVRMDAGVYELYPFVTGRLHRFGDLTELRCLARVLARFHEVTAAYRLELGEPLYLEQFSLSVPGTPGSTRLEDPVCLRAALTGALPLLTAPERQLVRKMQERVEEIEVHYGPEIYRQLDRYMVHGDFTFANVLFQENGEVAGLFDFDWATFGPRVRDLAEAVHFFASGQSRDNLAGSIWTLTDAPEFNLERSRVFLETYAQALPLDAEEAAAIRWAWQARWLGIHIESMYKVAKNDRGRFLTRDVEKPLRWMDEHADALCAGLA